MSGFKKVECKDVCNREGMLQTCLIASRCTVDVIHNTAAKQTSWQSLEACMCYAGCL